jgi:hypothetical protein
MRIFFLRRYALLFALILGCPANLFSAVWNSSVPAGTYSENITIAGDSTLDNGNVTILASGATYTVTPSGGNRVLTHSNSYTLTLNANTGGKIIFDLTKNDLQFEGATQPFEIFVVGDGVVEFQLAGGRSVSFKEGSAGTKVYVVMSNPGPTLQFVRVGNDTQNVFINIGVDSLMTYIDNNQLGAGGADDTGTILFDPTNPSDDTGRMVLNIANTGGMIIASHWLDAGAGVVHLNIPGAGQPLFEVENLVGTVANAGLMVVNGNATLFDLSSDPWCTGIYNGNRYGFVLGNNALLEIDENTYFDYVGTQTNQCPNPVITCAEATPASSFVKERNPSAFFVDGLSTTSNPASVPAAINLGECAAMVFRSGVNKFGIVENPIGMTYSDTTFTVDPANKTLGAGNVVFDVEGLLDVTGESVSSAKIEILSLAVNPTGGLLLSSTLTDCTDVIFPLRSFTTDVLGNYLAYNSAYFLFNNNVTLHNLSLDHTDVNHTVLEKNDVDSEPTYVGGESFALLSTPPNCANKPKMIFDNADLLVQENIAFTGLDLLVTNFACDTDNISNFIFCQNGYKIDDGTGRQMILGTCIGSTSCDGCTTICKDVQLDVMPSFTCDEPSTLQLSLQNWYNDETIVQDIADACTKVPIECQLAVHTIYLGHSSNISIGKQQTITACPIATLDIAGNFFSIDARGGNKNSPENSNITGQGGIFVDNLGFLTIEPGARANISTMVTKSGSGDINLPKNQVFFHDRIGIADWWTDPALVGPDQCLSDYTINWMALKKQYCDFIPYLGCSCDNCYNSCPAACQPVLPVNITLIPTVQGSVEQLQIKASRIGDPVHLKVDGGYVRELVFLTGCHSAEAPTAVLVLQNEGRVGLGTANKNPDSTQTSGLLGVNGIQIVANGSGRIDLNSDLVINNVCHILKGPDFTETDTLTFYTEVPHKIIVKEGAVLDISSFGADVLRHPIHFAGHVVLVFEPGSHLELGAAADSMVGMTMLDKSQILINPDRRPRCPCSGAFCTAFMATRHTRACNPAGSVTDTDPFRVKFTGVGEILLADQSHMDIPKYAYLGIENWQAAGILLTDINFHLRDAGAVYIGDEHLYHGGSLQIGNTKDVKGGSVSWKLQFDGFDTKFAIGEQGLLAFALGVIDKSSNLPNDWCFGSLFNVDTIDLHIENGTFQHNLIYRGDDPRASLLAIGTGPSYNFFLSSKSTNPVGLQLFGILSAGHMLGGGNIALDATVADEPRNLPVLDANSPIASILKSHTYFSSLVNAIGLTSAQLMALIRVTPVDVICNGKDVIGPNTRQDYIRVGLAMDTGPLTGSLIRQDANFIQALNTNGGSFSNQIDSLLAAEKVHGGSMLIVSTSAAQPQGVIVRLLSYQ